MAAPIPYRHTQFGWAIAIGTGIGLAFATFVTLRLSAATIAAVPWMIAALFGVIAIGFALFATLTVEVEDGVVKARFGIGLIRREVQVADILRCDRVRTRIRWGWGLHWTPTGWLYNVGGRSAVRLELRQGRALIIGTDEPELLAQAIEAARGDVHGN